MKKKQRLKRDISRFRERWEKERDRRYEERFKSIPRASRLALAATKSQTAATFTSTKEMTLAALASSQRANDKYEAAQDRYNTGHNDLTRKMEKQYETMMPRLEVMDKIGAVHHELAGKLDDIREEIGLLRESRSEVEGQSKGTSETKQGITAAQATLIATLGLLLALYAAFRP